MDRHSDLPPIGIAELYGVIKLRDHDRRFFIFCRIGHAESAKTQ